MVDLQEKLRIVGYRRNRWANVIDALTASPVIRQTIEGASTLTLEFADPERVFLRSPIAGQRAWAAAGGVHWEYVRLTKAGERLTMEFEDAIAAALRRRDGKLRVPADSTTRVALVRRLAKAAGVKAVIYPAKAGRIKRGVQRGTKNANSKDSWELLEELASDVNWRRFSNGRRLVVGPDDWLLERDSSPLVVKEYAGPCHTIDFDLDVGKRASKATMIVDVRSWSLPVGSVVRVHDHHGPAAGRWLVSELEWTLTSSRASVSLIRGKHRHKEPRPSGNARPLSEAGSQDFLPDLGGSAGLNRDGSGRPGRMAAWALTQRSADYQRGAQGPDAYDASGLVAKAAALAGRPLPAPAAAQWARIVDRGAEVSISRALRTRGALLFRFDENGRHVAISLGNGSTVEAHGPAHGVTLVGDAADRGWTGAGLWT